MFTYRPRAALALAALAFAVPAAAHAKPIVHTTPKVPVVINDHQYKPQQIHRFDGRPLYMHPSTGGKKLIAYTSFKRYQTYLRKHHIHLPAAPGTRAHAAGPGAVGGFCTDRFRQGWCFNLNSGLGVTDLRSYDGCNIWGNCSWYEQNLDYAETNAPAVMLWDSTNFRGNTIALPSGAWDLRQFGWSNRAWSIAVAW